MKLEQTFSHIKRGITPYTEALTEVYSEILWPTRCAICQKPGEVLCSDCLLHLPYNDYWRRCPRCGSPFGSIQCCDCNPIVLSRKGIPELPYKDCINVLRFDDVSARLVVIYKDGGEQRLHKPMATLFNQSIPAYWIDECEALTYIPSSQQALRQRGFDHMNLVAAEISRLSGLPCCSVFEHPRKKDQRNLATKDRFTNLKGSFTLKKDADIPKSLLVIDDVYTTGSTLHSACSELKNQGVELMYAMTLCRVL